MTRTCELGRDALNCIFGSIVVSIAACHVGSRGSITRPRVFYFLNNFLFVSKKRFFFVFDMELNEVFFFSWFKALNLVSDSLQT